MWMNANRSGSPHFCFQGLAVPKLCLAWTDDQHQETPLGLSSNMKGGNLSPNPEGPGSLLPWAGRGNVIATVKPVPYGVACHRHLYFL